MPEPNWTPVEAAFYELLRSLLTVWNELGLPAEERDAVEALLAQAEQGRPDALNRARRRLRRHEQVRQWLDEAHGRAVGEASKGPLMPGDPAPQARRLYRCPTPGCEYVWYRRVAAATPPPCPVHGCDLDEVQVP